MSFVWILHIARAPSWYIETTPRNRDYAAMRGQWVSAGIHRTLMCHKYSEILSVPRECVDSHGYLVPQLFLVSLYIMPSFTILWLEKLNYDILCIHVGRSIYHTNAFTHILYFHFPVSIDDILLTLSVDSNPISASKDSSLWYPIMNFLRTNSAFLVFSTINGMLLFWEIQWRRRFLWCETEEKNQQIDDQSAVLIRNFTLKAKTGTILLASYIWVGT